MAMSVLGLTATANETKTLKILSYNVAGLPIDLDVHLKQAAIGKYINDSDYDIVALQEDFTFHMYLDEQVKTYPYETNHSGSIPWGDGLNVYSKTKIYEEYREEWDMLSGVVDGGNDELTPKGFLYTVIELEDGVYLDLYTIHADAYGDSGSVAARTDNFRQLAEHINARKTDRPVIVVGDFNAFLHQKTANSDTGVTKYMINGAGMKDGWVECHNNGDYDDFSYYIDKYGAGYNSTCGVWDSIERAMFKNGGGVELEITKLTYDVIEYDGMTELSDHPALNLEFTYTKTDDFKENEDDLTVKEEDEAENIFRRIYYFFMDIIKLLTNWDALMELLGINK
jgi:endonuclease/exonuclease/phosphatase family metal-dependent hydrolase